MARDKGTKRKPAGRLALADDLTSPETAGVRVRASVQHRHSWQLVGLLATIGRPAQAVGP